MGLTEKKNKVFLGVDIEVYSWTLLPIPLFPVLLEYDTQAASGSWYHKSTLCSPYPIGLYLLKT